MIALFTIFSVLFCWWVVPRAEKTTEQNGENITITWMGTWLLVHPLAYNYKVARTYCNTDAHTQTHAATDEFCRPHTLTACQSMKFALFVQIVLFSIQSIRSFISYRPILCGRWSAKSSTNQSYRCAPHQYTFSGRTHTQTHSGQIAKRQTTYTEITTETYISLYVAVAGYCHH